jgi:branched-chain amino acid aminotransferase
VFDAEQFAIIACTRKAPSGTLALLAGMAHRQGEARMYLTYFDGEWKDGNVPLIGATDHAAWLGSIVFDGARALHGHLPDLDLHLRRLRHSAERLGLECPLSLERMHALVRDGLARFPPDAELYIRPMVFGTAGFLIPEPDRASFALTLFDAPLPPFAGFSACLSPLRRPDASMAPTDAKASSLYTNTTRALREAKLRGYDNAVMLDSADHVAEFCTSNLFFVASTGTVVTPIANGTFLAGITRARVIDLLNKESLRVEERVVRPEELHAAVEIFNTGNFGKVLPCTRYEGRTLEIGPVARLARERYEAWTLTQ